MIPDGIVVMFVDFILLDALWSEGQLSLQQKRLPEYLLGGKGDRCVELTTLPFSDADCKTRVHGE